MRKRSNPFGRERRYISGHGIKKFIFRFPYFAHDVTSQQNCSQFSYQNFVFWDTLLWTFPMFCKRVVVFVRDLDNLGTCKLYIVYSASSGNVIYIVYILELYVMSMLMQHSHSASGASIGRFRWSEEALLFRAEVDCVGCEPSFTGIFFGFILT